MKQIIEWIIEYGIEIFMMLITALVFIIGVFSAFAIIFLLN